MYTQTQSTDISVLQLPERPVKEWARTMLQNGKALRLLQLIDLLPQISQLQTQGILSEFADIKEADVIQPAKGANKSSEKSLQERKDLWKALRDSEAQYIDEISSIMPSGKPEINLQIAVGYLSKCTQAYYGKFVTYLEKTKATQSQMASFKNLRHVSHAAITHFSLYLDQVTEAIGINRLSEIMKPRERVRSASQQKGSAKKKRQNQGQGQNPFAMPAESSSNKIKWRTISTQKIK